MFSLWDRKSDTEIPGNEKEKILLFLLLLSSSCRCCPPMISYIKFNRSIARAYFWLEIRYGKKRRWERENPSVVEVVVVVVNVVVIVVVVLVVLVVVVKQLTTSSTDDFIHNIQSFTPTRIFLLWDRESDIEIWGQWERENPFVPAAGFLDAFSHLYKRVCPSVRRSVNP